MRVWPGEPYPLGATYNGMGTNFSLFSEVAEAVELCLFDAQGDETRVSLPEVTGYCWHGYLPDVGPGQRYGYRVHGPWDPARGHRCNPAKLVMCPYAKAVEGNVRWGQQVFPYTLGDPHGPPDPLDSARHVPLAEVVNPFFDWGNDRQPRIPWHETVIYEAHVKGFTMRHPEIPLDLRGTYSGLAHPVAVDHLLSLGVTTVELMPVHQFVHASRLVDLGLRNYWGYDTLTYFAPHDAYASNKRPGAQVGEFKQMVRTLHEAGLEVILDVVYNHTAEGNHLGPMLSMKGIDNLAYYRLLETDRRMYLDYTGTGNTLNMRHPHVLQLIMDSLRYWVLEMHVDGFRFDLAATLARELHDVDRLAAFFDLIQQDPVVSQVKLIAEPWDVGAGGYQVGRFPPLWSEWNGRYRDTVRDWWRGADRTLGELANRFTGSSDLYESTGRRPYASINFVTAHDGFTLEDLVSYNEKHNLDNGEENTDGTDDNRSWNCGEEGPSADPEIRALRDRQRRNLLATLFLSQGVPMLLGGDELGRTQGGNNNAYCQDNEVSWFDWENVEAGFLDWVRRLVAFRTAHPVFHRRRFFHGRPIHGTGVRDLVWFNPNGEEMEEEHWGEGTARSLGIYLNGEGIASPTPRGERVVDDTFYLMFNAHHDVVSFRLPPAPWGRRWVLALDTGRPDVPDGDDGAPVAAGATWEVAGRSLVMLRRADEP